MSLTGIGPKHFPIRWRFFASMPVQHGGGGGDFGHEAALILAQGESGISGFGGSLTGRDSLRLVCRIYGVDWRDKLGFVQDFTELGRYFDEPMQS